MSHTPGPWRYQRDPANDKRVIHAPWNHGNVATINPVQEACEANGHLIAAAPDLLEAVERACAALDMCLNSGDTAGAELNADETLMALRAILKVVKS